MAKTDDRLPSMTGESPTGIAEPRPSATVMLVRDAGGRPEILMLQRHTKTTFGDVHVFPGGVLEPGDADVHDRFDGLQGEEAGRILGTADALDYYSAAIRELFEETGVLLATPEPDAMAGSRHGKSQRDRLMSGAICWDRWLREQNLVLAGRRLHYFAHWVTPRSENRRFSTRFFMAAMPAGQVASHDGAELTDSCWMAATDVLASQKAGRMRLIYPTYRTLREIADMPSVHDIEAWAVDRQRSGVARILPAIVEIDGKEKVVLPGDPRYPAGDLP